MKPQNLLLAIAATMAPFAAIAPVQAATFTDLQFLSSSTALTEVLNLATPGQILSNNTPVQYNTINDATGTKLTTDNGDVKDFTLSGSSTTSSLGTTRVVVGATGASTPLAAVDSGRIGAQHSYTGTVSTNNPGSIQSNTFKLLFNPNLSVTNATFNFSSLNTAGVAWEYSVIQFLNPSGTPFNALTNPGWAIGAASQYGSAGSGFNGQAGLGNFIAASTGVVTGVGTAQSASGTSGTNDNIAAFNYALAGLTPGTQIGGIQWTTYLEDVRGTNNGNTNFTSSLLDFTISGSTASEVIPTPALLPGLIGMTLGVLRKRKQQDVA